MLRLIGARVLQRQGDTSDRCCDLRGGGVKSVAVFGEALAESVSPAAPEGPGASEGPTKDASLRHPGNQQHVSPQPVPQAFDAQQPEKLRGQQADQQPSDQQPSNDGTQLQQAREVGDVDDTIQTLQKADRLLQDRISQLQQPRHVYADGNSFRPLPKDDWSQQQLRWLQAHNQRTALQQQQLQHRQPTQVPFWQQQEQHRQRAQQRVTTEAQLQWQIRVQQHKALQQQLRQPIHSSGQDDVRASVSEGNGHIRLRCSDRGHPFDNGWRLDADLCTVDRSRPVHY